MDTATYTRGHGKDKTKWQEVNRHHIQTTIHFAKPPLVDEPTTTLTTGTRNAETPIHGAL